MHQTMHTCVSVVKNEGKNQEATRKHKHLKYALFNIIVTQQVKGRRKLGYKDLIVRN